MANAISALKNKQKKEEDREDKAEHKADLEKKE